MTNSTAFRLTPLAAACALMLLGAAGAGHAQQADEAPAAAAAKPAEGELATVTVAGIRRGIEQAISIKKNASSIVEAISAEDIGKLPDTTVAESISRLSGVTTQRNKTNGKATDVSVRGLSPSLTAPCSTAANKPPPAMRAAPSSTCSRPS
jgi:iron complex outermembrane receptor protein